MTRAALYARTSVEEGEKFGLASQVTELRALAAANGYEVVAEYLDDGHSGATLDRPALGRLRDAVRAGGLTAVLIYDTDRLSRKLAHQLLLLDEFDGAGVLVVFQQTPRQNTPEGMLLLNIKGAIGEFERLKIKERTSRGKREKARRGLLPHGRAPFGYRPSSTEPGKLVIHDDEARVIRLLFTWLLGEQRSLRQITQALDREGHPAPQGSRWVPSTVKRLVTSEVYLGRMVWNRWAWTGRTRRERPESEWIPIAVPAIVHPWQVERAQAQLQRNRTLWSGRPTPRFYLLRGLLVCGACGRPWHGSPSHGRRRYRCASRDRAYYVESCESPSWTAERLEAIIWETVTGILRDPDLLESKLEAYRAKVGVRDVEIRSASAHVARQIATLDRQERKLLDLYLEEEVASPAVRVKVAEIAARRQALKARADGLRVRIGEEEAAASRRDSVKTYCNTAVKGLGALTQEGRRQLVLALVDRVVVSRDRLEVHGLLPGTVAGISMGATVSVPQSYVLILATDR
jgi:site-specific DNA recombinase